MTKDILVLNYADKKSLEIIGECADQLAGILVEPVQSRYPEIDPREFLHDLRHITKENNIALIFDEVITGFRFAVGGASEMFNVKPDISTYGKVIGGGLPIGIVAGASEYLNFIDGGAWNFGDASHPISDQTFFAGTFCKHPLAMAATQAVLLKMLSLIHI